MSKMVPKVMINMNEYIPSGILGKKVKLDFSKKHGVILERAQGFADRSAYNQHSVFNCYGNVNTPDNNSMGSVTERNLDSAIVNAIVLGKQTYYIEVSDFQTSDNYSFDEIESGDVDGCYLCVTLDQLAQNGGVSWYSKPLASVREAVAA